MSRAAAAIGAWDFGVEKEEEEEKQQREDVCEWTAVSYVLQTALSLSLFLSENTPKKEWIYLSGKTLSSF